MYNSYFGFREKPFKLVPNPDYLFLSKSHEIALAHLSYATDQGDGFVVITGEVGTGKTTLCRNYLEALDDQTSSAYIFNPRLDSPQLLGSICAEFGITTEATQIKELLDLLNSYLIGQNASGRKVVLLIDEAQGLSVENLEMVRMLSNLETTRSKLLQIILVGQPELADKLDSYELRQLAQRISLNYHLSPLTAKETESYIYHRLGVATQRQAVHFSANACRAAYHFSGGIPRLINIVCDRALLLAFSNNRPKVSKSIMQSAIRELLSRGQTKRTNHQWAFMLGGSVLLATVAVLIAYIIWRGDFRDDHKSPVAARNPETVLPAPPSQEETFSIPATTHIEPSPAGSQTPTQAGAQMPAPLPAEPQTPTQGSAKMPAPPSANTQTPAPVSASTQSPAPLPTEDPHFAQPEVASATAESSEGILAASANKLPVVEPAEKIATGSAAADVVPIETIIAALDPKETRKKAVSVLLTLWQQPRPNPNLLPDQLEDAMFYDLAARQYGLRTYATRWDWAFVQQLDLPAIIALRQPGTSQNVYLALTGEKQGRLQLSQGGHAPVIETDLETLTPHIAGPIYLFWRNSIGFDMLIGFGANRNAVLSVKHLLRQIGYHEVPLTPEFDIYTQDVVKTFQARHNLVADGLVGPVTKIMLLREADSRGIPHLISRKRADS